MLLQDLPLDILVSIVDSLDPVDFLAFSACCRACHDAGESSQHQSLRNRYSDLTVCQESLPALLHEIWSDWRVAYYVQEITYVQDDVHVLARPALRKLLGECLIDLIDLNMLPPKCADEAIKLASTGPTITSGNTARAEATLLCILLILLTNLRRLELRRTRVFAPDSSLITRTLCGILGAQIESRQKRSLIRKSAPLTQLVEVGIRNAQGEGVEEALDLMDVEFIKMWAILPSVKRIWSACINAEETGGLMTGSFGVSVKPGHVTGLHLHDSYIAPIPLALYGELLTHLTSFSYTLGVSKDRRYERELLRSDRDSVLEALQKSARGLTVLRLKNAFEVCVGEKGVDYRMFQVRTLLAIAVHYSDQGQRLELLEVDGTFLLHVRPNDRPEIVAPALVDILPSSVKRVEICISSLGHLGKQLLKRWEWKSNERVGNLETMQYKGAVDSLDSFLSFSSRIQYTGVQFEWAKA